MCDSMLVDIPTYRDLMYPTLVAVTQLGGSAAIAELEEKVPELAGVTDEQLGVVYPKGSTLEGQSKVINRCTGPEPTSRRLELWKTAHVVCGP